MALRSELERPAVVIPESGHAVDIARAYAERLARVREATTTDQTGPAEALSSALSQRLQRYLEPVAGRLAETFATIDGATLGNVVPLRTRTAVVDLDLLTLRLSALDHTLTYTVAIVREGSGPLFLDVEANVSGRQGSPTALQTRPTDLVTLVPGDTVDGRWPEIVDLVDRTLAAAVDLFGSSLR